MVVLLLQLLSCVHGVHIQPTATHTTKATVPRPKHQARQRFVNCAANATSLFSLPVINDGGNWLKVEVCPQVRTMVTTANVVRFVNEVPLRS